MKATNPEGQVTDLTGTIVSVKFRPMFVRDAGAVWTSVHGRSWMTALTTTSGFTLATLPTSGGFVALQGTVRRDGSILASDVEFITTDSSLCLWPHSGFVRRLLDAVKLRHLVGG